MSKSNNELISENELLQKKIDKQEITNNELRVQNRKSDNAIKGLESKFENFKKITEKSNIEKEKEIDN